VSPRAVVIDTDPGIDDAMAIAVALASPELEVLALTTTFGNHDLVTTTANAQRVLDAMGRPEIPVIAGAHRPLVRGGHQPATSVHGLDGLGDADLPPPSRPPVAGLHAAQRIVDLVRERPGEITLVPIGPLTNLALALHLDPGIADQVAGVVAMGGAVRVPGNVTPAAEANIWNDPEAADLVLGADWPVTLLGLDVTAQLAADRGMLDRIDALGTPGAHLVSVTAPAYVDFHRVVEGFDGIHCHDVATIAHLLRPDLVRTETMAVRVASTGLAAGQTLGSATRIHDPEWGDRPGVQVGVGVDGPQLLDLVLERLARVPGT
jgi:inosine-uridine nucleoside N-ribohydrolase